jgi:thioredoxin-like negative regulator of GroEL
MNFDSYRYYGYDRRYRQNDLTPYKNQDDKINQLPPKRPQQLPETASVIEWHLRNIVHAFAVADYSKAAFRARQAVKFAPENIDLRLAYSQSLFADSQYQRAQRVLQTALNIAAQTNQQLFFPIDFYQSRDLLNKQTERLRQTIEDSRSGTELQFLLAYQLFGLGNYDQAFDALTIARIDYTNKDAVEVLLTALDQAKKGEKTEPVIEKETPPKTDNY